MIERPYIERPYRREAGAFATTLGVALVVVLVLTFSGGASGASQVASFWDLGPIEVGAAGATASEMPRSSAPSSLPVVEFRSEVRRTTADVLREAEPLAHFSAVAAAIAAQGDIAPSVAIVDLRDGAVYSQNGDRDHNLLSVAKIPILLATMEEAVREQRPLSESERLWLGWMITVSDNGAAGYLWQGLGGTGPVDALFREAGLAAPRFVREDRWGTMRASALEVAWLLAAMAAGDLVAEETRWRALGLLDQVDQLQRWGVGAGLEDGRARLKNGWFQLEDAWWLRSAGVVYGGDGRPMYALVVMTDTAQSFAGGVAAIEAIASAIHQADGSEARLASLSAGE